MQDTRRTGLLLKTLQRRHDQRLISCHEYNYHARIPTLLQHMEAGSSVALVSDAGTPCVSDPGIQLVTAAVAAGVQVVPLPGACAAISALVASTMPVAKFTFLGFLPRAGEERRTALHHIATSCATVVLYEAPHRLMATLGSLALVEGEGRPVCLARELTKKWEQFLRFHTVASAIEYYQREHVQPKGEFTIVLAPTVVKQPNRDDISAYSQVNVDVAKLVHSLVRDGVPVSTVARCVSTSTNTPKKLIYTYASQCKKELQHYQNHTPG